MFGYEYFKYFNIDVAILIAAYGRYTLNKMIELAKNQGLRVVYGDTDSVFVVKGDYEPITANEVEQLTSKYAEILNVEVKYERTFERLIIAKKKHYLGIAHDKNKEPIIKGFEGIKSDRVEWVRKTFEQLVDDYKNCVNPIPKLKEALLNLEQWTIKEPERVLHKTTRLGKDPEDYENNCLQKRIGLEVGLKRGDTVNHYLADNERGYTFDVNECSISQYRKMLLSTVKDVLEILGHGVELEVLHNHPPNPTSLCDIIDR